MSVGPGTGLKELDTMLVSQLHPNTHTHTVTCVNYKVYRKAKAQQTSQLHLGQLFFSKEKSCGGIRTHHTVQSVHILTQECRSYQENKWHKQKCRSLGAFTLQAAISLEGFLHITLQSCTVPSSLSSQTPLSGSPGLSCSLPAQSSHCPLHSVGSDTHVYTT